MRFPHIDIMRIGGLTSLDYLVHKLPQIDFVNSAIENSELMALTMMYVEELYNSWKTQYRENEYSHILRPSAILGWMQLVHPTPEKEDYTFKEKVEYMLSYCLGVFCNEHRDDFLVPFILDFSVDNDWTGFVASFNPTREELSEIIRSNTLKQGNLLQDLTLRRKVNDGFEEVFESESLDEKIKSIDSPYFEGEFFVLYEYFGLTMSLLLKHGDIDLYLDFLMQYSIPNIQNQALKLLKDSDEIVELYKRAALRIDNSDMRTLLLHVILNHWYDNIVALSKNYSVSLTHLPSVIADRWDNLKERFCNSRDRYITNAFSAFVRELGAVPVAKFLFSKKPIVYPRETLDSKVTNEVLAECKKKALTIIGTDGFDSTIGDLSYLSVFFEYYTDHDGNESIYRDLQIALLNSLAKDKFYLSGGITSELLSRLQVFSRFLYKRFENSLADLYSQSLSRFGVAYEGINVDNKDFDMKASVETRMLMIFLCITSIPPADARKKKLFETISEYTLKQCNYCMNRELIANYYLRVLELCELIADQCLPEEKSSFEDKCVDIFPDVFSLSFVFANSQISLSRKAHDWVDNMTTSEIPIIIQRLNSRQQNQHAKKFEAAVEYIQRL